MKFSDTISNGYIEVEDCDDDETYFYADDEENDDDDEKMIRPNIFLEYIDNESCFKLSELELDEPTFTYK